MMKKVLVFVLGVFMISLVTSAKDITIAGSTTFQKRIMEPCTKLVEEKTGIKVTTLGINSGKGLQMLVEGKVIASISSSPLDKLFEDLKLKNDGSYVENIIIIDNIIPIVNKSNNVNNLTWQQLSDIHTGKIKNWNEVGGDDSKIIIVTSQPTAATRLVFQDLVMKKQEYVKEKIEVKSTREEIENVAKLKGGIGAVSEGFLSLNPGKVKELKSEKISRPLSVITKGKPNEDIQKIIDVLLSKEAIALYQ